MHVPFTSLTNRMNGLSGPCCGVSWQPSATECTLASKLVTFLDDRRSCYQDAPCESGLWVIGSVLQIRQNLDATLIRIEN